MSVWSRGRLFFWAWCVFDVGNQGRLLCGPVSLPVCLSVWVTTLTCPHTRRPASVCVFVCVCVCLNVCVVHVYMYAGCATPCLRSTVQPISPLHVTASIIHPTTFIVSRHFLLSSTVTGFYTQMQYSSKAVFKMLSALIYCIQQ